MPEAEEPIVVYVSQGPLQAEVARAKLEANNIPAILRYSPVGRAFGITVDGLGRVDVLVHPRDATAAGALLAEMASHDLGEADSAAPPEPGAPPETDE